MDNRQIAEIHSSKNVLVNLFTSRYSRKSINASFQSYVIVLSQCSHILVSIHHQSADLEIIIINRTSINLFHYRPGLS